MRSPMLRGRPVSSKTAGSVRRSRASAYPGKQTAEVHDYHEREMPVLAAALSKRAPGYVGPRLPRPQENVNRSQTSRRRSRGAGFVGVLVQVGRELFREGHDKMPVECGGDSSESVDPVAGIHDHIPAPVIGELNTHAHHPLLKMRFVGDRSP
jgi:hypothetical protein